jgi:hypothetical protein
MKLVSLILVLGIATSAQAQSTPATNAPPPVNTSGRDTESSPITETSKSTEPDIKISQLDRMTGMDRLLRPWNVSFELSTLSLLVPLKPSLSASYAFDPEWAFEVSAMSGSLSAGWLSAELGRYTETSFSVLLRSYGTRSSFHYLIGVSQENTRIQIGNRYVDMATGVGSIDIAQTQSWALVLGVGQAWKLRNGVTLGIDYARIAYPLIVANTDSAFLTSNANGDKKGFIADTLNTAAKIPRFSFLQFNVGWSF